jgi:hypothetical protein
MRLQKCQLFVGLLLLIASASTAGVQSSSVDRGQLLKDLEVLAADDMRGRQPGTLAERRRVSHRSTFQRGWD